jgi:hypothetical protein
MLDGQCRVEFYRPTMNRQAPSETEALVFAILTVLAILLAGFWIVFPVLVYDQLKRIRKAISEQKPPAPPVFDLSEVVKLRNDFRAVNFNRIAYGACGLDFDFLVRLSGTLSTCPHCNAEVNLP